MNLCYQETWAKQKEKPEWKEKLEWNEKLSLKVSHTEETSREKKQHSIRGWVLPFKWMLNKKMLEIKWFVAEEKIDKF